jgi:hypothetical protein
MAVTLPAPPTVPDAGKAILTVAGAIAAGILGVAVLAVIVGKNANTANTIGAATGGLAKIIGAAVAPVSGSGTNIGSTASQPLGALGTIGGTTPGNIGSYSGLFSQGVNAINSFDPNSFLNQDFSSADSSGDNGYYQDTGGTVI